MTGLAGATGAMSKVTVLFVLVEAVLLKPAASVTALALTVAITVPALVMPLTATLYVLPLPVTVFVFVPVAVPVTVTPLLLKPVTDVLKTTVKLMGDPVVGSA